MFKFNPIIFSTILCLTACASNDEEISTNSVNNNTTNITLSQNKDMTKTEEASLTVQMVPDWCTEMPLSKTSIHACGIGNSSNLNMSNSRAIIDGKSKLASQINNEITSRMTDLLEDLGNYDEQVKQASERVIKSVSAETQIAGYQEIKSEFQNIGDKFQTYVLLEYPIDQANQLLFKQIKQDSILSNQEAIDSALEELEAEINKKN
mgnify:FL=1